MRAAWVVIVAAACGHSSKVEPAAPPQTFAAGVQVVCDVPDHVPEAAQPEQRLAGAGKWLDEHVTNADARKLGDLAALSIDKELLADAAQRAGLTRCKLLDNGMSLQSYTDAIKIVCAAPLGDRDKTAAYVRAHLLNAEAIRLVESLGTADPALARKKLADSAILAGVSDCALVK